MGIHRLQVKYLVARVAGIWCGGIHCSTRRISGTGIPPICVDTHE